jgi:hypothetical protein
MAACFRSISPEVDIIILMNFLVNKLSDESYRLEVAESVVGEEEGGDGDGVDEEQGVSNAVDGGDSCGLPFFAIRFTKFFFFFLIKVICKEEAGNSEIKNEAREKG